MGLSPKSRCCRELQFEKDTDISQDRELWNEEANCLVHFYAQGSSQRGPSLKVPFKAVKASGSPYLLGHCLHKPLDRELSSATANGSDSGYDSSETVDGQVYELYVPAPVLLTREQAYAYHVTTRNYFAYLTGQSLVGEKLGLALADLWSRAKEWQGDEDTTTKVLNFCEAQGYLRITGNPHWATAIMNLAERARLSDLWIHAYVHCVGMHYQRDLSPEFDSLTNVTKALITRASLELELHIARVIRAVGTFLEEEFSVENLGISKHARDHLDRFQSFLHSYYVDKFGYFGPSTSDAFDKKLWLELQQDFQSLYDYLVDKDSDMQPSNHGASGGMCVLQNVQAFDNRHGYESLPHPLPLLPPIALARATSHQNGLRSFRLGRSDSTSNESSRLPPKMALAKATNSNDEAAVSSPIVQEYQRFEKQKVEEKIHIVEARKVRWLLIYGVLQMLTSITRAPKEVKDYEAAPYPLCVLTSNCPPWEEAKAIEEPERAQPAALPQTPLEEAEKFFIRPDCDAPSAEDYFSLSRRGSVNALDMTPAPLRITVPVSRTASIRSSVQYGVNALQKSVAGSFNRRNSTWRRSRSMSVQQQPSFAEPMRDDHEDDAPDTDTTKLQTSESSVDHALAQLQGETPRPGTADQFAAFDFGLNDVAEEPTLDQTSTLDHTRTLSPEPILHVDQLDDSPISTRPSSSIRDSWVTESAFTTRSPTDTDSPVTASPARSSYASSVGTPATDLSLSYSNSPISTAKTSIDFARYNDKPLPFIPTARAERDPRASYAQRHLNFGCNTFTSTSTTNSTSLNVGTYKPSGLKPGTYRPTGLPIKTTASMRPALSRYSSVQGKERGRSADSSHSSVYAEGENLQAADIEEEELRGRRRSRALDGVGKFSFGF